MLTCLVLDLISRMILYILFLHVPMEVRVEVVGLSLPPTNSHTDPLAQSATPYATLRHGHNNGPRESHSQPINDATKEYVSNIFCSTASLWVLER